MSTSSGLSNTRRNTTSGRRLYAQLGEVFPIAKGLPLHLHAPIPCMSRSNGSPETRRNRIPSNLQIPSNDDSPPSPSFFSGRKAHLAQAGDPVRKTKLEGALANWDSGAYVRPVLGVRRG